MMPDWLSDALTVEYARNPLWLWILAGLIAIAGTLILASLRTFIVRQWHRRAVKTATHLDDFAVELIDKTHAVLFLALMIAVGITLLELPDKGEEWTYRIVVIVALWQGGVWAGTIIQRFIERRFQLEAREDPAKATGVALLRFMSLVAIWAIVLLTVLAQLGVNITALVAGLGVGGIAVALALQNVLGDLFASVSILLDKPFVVGDFIIIDSFMGSVEQIGVKTTQVRSLGGEQIIFPNADLLKSRIRNYKRMHERRVVFKIGVVYSTPLELVQQIPDMLRDSVTRQSDVRFDRAHFASYGDFSLVFEVVYYVLSPDFNRYMDIQQAINFEIYRRFEAAGIAFAFPTQTLHIHGVSNAPKLELT